MIFASAIFQAAFVPSSESALDTSYFTSRYSWNTSDDAIYPASDFEDSSDADSLSGSSGCLSNRHDEVVLCPKVFLNLRKFLCPPAYFAEVTHSWAIMINREMNVKVLLNLSLVHVSITPSVIFHSRYFHSPKLD